MSFETNEVRLVATLLKKPRVGVARYRGQRVERVTLLVDVEYAPRHDRFRIEVTCPGFVTLARSLQVGQTVLVVGVLRRTKLLGRIFVAIDIGQGAIAHQGFDAECALAEWMEHMECGYLRE